MSASSAAAQVPLFQRGRSFVHPGFDYLLIGGGLSLLVIPWLPSSGNLTIDQASVTLLPALVLMFNSAHFASSTLRLYSKPGALQQWPFLTLAFPLVTLAVVTAGIALASTLGRSLFEVYLGWSPYHYAAQAYGIALLYAYRSGCTMSDGDKRLLRWLCLMPFFYAVTTSANTGLAWVLPLSARTQWPLVGLTIEGLEILLIAAAFIGPAVFVRRLNAKGQSFPAISLLLVATNGVWWIVFSYLEAFLWATVFHGIQYLAIVIVFHLRDHPPASGARMGWLAPTLKFYAGSLVLGYGLFSVWPWAYQGLGFRFGEAMLVCAAAINLHHFIVDAYIWRAQRDRVTAPGQ